jgi:hypothetical protein
VRDGQEGGMAETDVRDEKKSKGWLAVIKKVVGILFWICVIAIVVALFVFSIDIDDPRLLGPSNCA